MKPSIINFMTTTAASMLFLSGCMTTLHHHDPSHHHSAPEAGLSAAKGNSGPEGEAGQVKKPVATAQESMHESKTTSAGPQGATGKQRSPGVAGARQPKEAFDKHYWADMLKTLIQVCVPVRCFK